MANYVYSDLQTEVSQQTGLDITDTTNASNILRWINFAQLDICARYPWPFMAGRESIVTVPDYSTGTVSINTGSSTVTGTGTVFTSTQGNGNYFIQFSSANDWYKVTAQISGTSLTIEQPYQPTANLVNGTYILRKVFYSLSASADRIIDVRNWNTPVKLMYVQPRTIDDLYPNPQSTNSSYGYIPWMYDASGNIQLIPYPFPNDGRLLELKTQVRPTAFAVAGDPISIPNKYAMVITFGANALACSFKREWDDAAAWNAKYEQRIMDMKKEYRMSEDDQPILRSIDSVQHTKWISLPEQYPAVTG